MDATNEDDRGPGAGPAATPAYFELVRAFPLTPLRDDSHLDEACRVVDGLLRQHLDAGGEAYLEVLSRLIEGYEDDFESFGECSPADVLRGLLEGNGMTRAEFAAEVKIGRSTLSGLLSGGRKFTAAQAARVAGRFGLTTGLFIPADTSLKPRG